VISDANVKASMFAALRAVPFVERKIAGELQATMEKTEKELTEQMDGMGYNRIIPEEGWNKTKVLVEIEKVMKLGMNIIRFA
jgi:hypothetical protein